MKATERGHFPYDSSQEKPTLHDKRRSTICYSKEISRLSLLHGKLLGCLYMQACGFKYICISFHIFVFLYLYKDIFMYFYNVLVPCVKNNC